MSFFTLAVLISPTSLLVADVRRSTNGPMANNQACRYLSHAERELLGVPGVLGPVLLRSCSTAQLRRLLRGAGILPNGDRKMLLNRLHQVRTLGVSLRYWGGRRVDASGGVSGLLTLKDDINVANPLVTERVLSVFTREELFDFVEDLGGAASRPGAIKLLRSEEVRLDSIGIDHLRDLVQQAGQPIQGVTKPQLRKIVMQVSPVQASP